MVPTHATKCQGQKGPISETDPLVCMTVVPIHKQHGCDSYTVYDQKEVVM